MDETTTIVIVVIILIITASIGGYFMLSGDEDTEFEGDSRSSDIDYNIGVSTISDIPEAEFNSDMSQATESNNIPNAQEKDIEKALEITESGGRCGPEHNEQRCPDTEMCNEGGHCGEGEQFDFGAYSKYSGPSSSYHDVEPPYTKKCGPQNNMTKCREKDICYEDGNCGPYDLAKAHTPFSKYAGPDSCYNAGQSCEPPLPEPEPEKEYECDHYNEEDFYNIYKEGSEGIVVQKQLCESKSGIFTQGENEKYKGDVGKCWCLNEKGKGIKGFATKELREAARIRALNKIKQEKGEIKDFETGYYKLKTDLAGVASQKETIKFSQKFKTIP